MSEREDAAHGLCVAGVVFDLDGTLVDSRRDIVGAVEVALSEHGIASPPADVIATFVGDGARLLVARALGMNTGDARVDPVLTTYLAHYEANPVDFTVPMPHAVAMLDAFDGVPLAVCTNKPRAIADLVLARLGLLEHFAAVVGGGDTLTSKPDRAPLVRAAELLGLPAARVAMVGDGVQDVACGRAAGAYTVAVLGGFGSLDTLQSAGPDLVISNLSELAPALRLSPAGKR
ncbi:MAG TPA: HAD-IA family hydrolase [Polyangiaceae bacterium]|nr:HAD-IA family hydrolase [Polyangiaceae bacterium]